MDRHSAFAATATGALDAGQPENETQRLDDTADATIHAPDDPHGLGCVCGDCTLVRWGGIALLCSLGVAAAVVHHDCQRRRNHICRRQHLANLLRACVTGAKAPSAQRTTCANALCFSSVFFSLCKNKQKTTTK
ncbi:hypothetical protein psal_cds_1150 [Pandoravirus salinus]|uniref:Uncharacterized protein n=1 Tax=Pandoravirus salinus TaxID=1349410 RepID=S4W0T9_9VIRU|nr:hypothetical protein psal_cds_1150 [Pandoravirus salinus]AGO85411.1 hypothetical protein psal_cds_1150 [Pandoravirus salinus]